MVKQKKKKKNLVYREFSAICSFRYSLAVVEMKRKNQEREVERERIWAICGQADRFKMINIVLFPKCISNIYAFYYVILTVKKVPHSLNNWLQFASSFCCACLTPHSYSAAVHNYVPIVCHELLSGLSLSFSQHIRLLLNSLKGLILSMTENLSDLVLELEQCLFWSIGNLANPVVILNSYLLYIYVTDCVHDVKYMSNFLYLSNLPFQQCLSELDTHLVLRLSAF